MDIRIIIFALVLLYYLFLGNGRNKPQSKNKLVRFVCFLFIIQSGLRHLSVGPDTYNYHEMFLQTMNSEWSEIIAAFFVESPEFRDPGYSIIVKLFTTVIPVWQVYLIALATLYFFAMGKLWKRYINSAEGVLLATALVLSLFNVIALSGMRQMITMSLSMLMIPYIEERKWKTVVPVLLLGSLIHVSLLFVFAFIPLQYVKKGNFRFLIGTAILTIPLITVFARSIVGFMAGQIANDYYLGYAESVNEQKPYVYIALCSLISLFLFLNYKSLKKAPSFFSSALVLMTVTFPLIIQDGAMIRIGQYFTIYIMLSLPYVIDDKQSRSIYYTGMISVLLFYIITNNFQYRFFWS